MPWLPPKPCAQPGCPKLVHDRYCDDHKRADRARVDRARNPEVRSWYKSARWQKARARQLAKHPLCQCADCGDGLKQVTPATVVDHDPPHGGVEEAFFDEARFVSMSKPCHDRKTARQDGGFGNPRRGARGEGG